MSGDPWRRALRCLTVAPVLALAACASAPTPGYTPPTLAPLQTENSVAPAPTSLSPTPAQGYTAATMVPLATVTPTATATPTPTAAPTTTLPCGETHGRVETGTYSSQILGRDVPYRIYLPPCYDAEERSYPVLYLLHGHPFDEWHWDRLGADETADSGIRSGAYPPFIAVMPNCDSSEEGIFANTSGGDSSVEGLIVNELLPHIDRTYRTWPQREGRAIGGISRGGVWSLEIGFRRPDLFAVVGAHSAALAVNYPHPIYDPLNLAAEPAVASLRIWLDAGDADWARVGVDELHRILDEHGVAHEYVLGEGSHENAYWSRMLPAYLAFYVADWPAEEP
jgi:enterochelin esterase-like enzyme